MVRSLSVPHRDRVRLGFTLIELLVVIAIIAILAAILFPVFAKARERAWATTCLSNCKQLALAFRTYAEDNDDRFVLSIYDSQRDKPPPYSVSNHGWGGRGTQTGAVKRPIDPYVSNAKQIMRCPSDHGVHATAGDQRPSWSDYNWDNSYVMNAVTMSRGSGAGAQDIVGLMVRNRGRWVATPMVNVRSYSEVREPARTILLGEHAMHCYWQDSKLFARWHHDQGQGLRTTRPIVAFVDGHARAITLVPGLDDPSGQWTFRVYGWKVANP